MDWKRWFMPPNDEPAYGWLAVVVVVVVILVLLVGR